MSSEINGSASPQKHPLPMSYADNPLSTPFITSEEKGIYWKTRIVLPVIYVLNIVHCLSVIGGAIGGCTDYQPEVVYLGFLPTVIKDVGSKV